MKLDIFHFCNKWSLLQLSLHFKWTSSFFILQTGSGSAKDEFGCNGCLSRAPSGQDVHVPIEHIDADESLTLDMNNPVAGVNKQRCLANQRRAVRIDEVCRFIFPLGFTLFNIFYWNYYKEVEVLDWIWVEHVRGTKIPYFSSFRLRICLKVHATQNATAQLA